ncbi:hypothetical protein AAHC03_052 [Spirometra sp. Aus1]
MAGQSSCCTTQTCVANVLYCGIFVSSPQTSASSGESLVPPPPPSLPFRGVLASIQHLQSPALRNRHDGQRLRFVQVGRELSIDCLAFSASVTLPLRARTRWTTAPGGAWLQPRRHRQPVCRA